MAVLAVIPARYGSTRFPGKLMEKINGKTLLQHTFENTVNSSCFDKVIVATDSPLIQEHVKEFGGETATTSSSCATGTDRVADAIASHKAYEYYDIVFNVQGDAPNIEPHVFAAVLQQLNQDSEAVMATAATPFLSAKEAETPSCVKVVLDCHQRALYFSRALIPSGKEKCGFRPEITYYHHLGVYAFRRSFLPIYANLPASPLQLAECLEQLKILENGYKIAVAVVKSSSFGIDTREDIKHMEKLR